MLLDCSLCVFRKLIGYRWVIIVIGRRLLFVVLHRYHPPVVA